MVGIMRSSTERKNYLFTNDDLKKLIIPLVLEQALGIMVGMADTMMISSAGEAAVSGVSLVDMINVFMFRVLGALATGGAVVVSQNIGAAKIDQARKSAKQLLFSSLVFSTFLACLIIIFKKGLMNLLFGSIEPVVMEASLTYLTITAISFPFMGLYNACAALFRSMSKSGVTFKVSIIGNVINIIGNAICVMGLHMGVAGVAIPSLVSRVVMGVILYVMLQNPEYEVHFVKEKFKVDFATIRNILYIGIPNSVESGIFQLGRVMVVSIISGFGTIQIAANGVANSLDTIGSMVGQAMNLAMITVIGRCVGAGDQTQIKYYWKKLVIITYVSSAVINIPILLGLDPILSLYGLGAETTQLAKTLIMIHNGFAMILWPMSFVFPNMLRACNDVRCAMAISIFSMIVFRVGFSYILGVQYGMGAVGVWIAMIIDWCFRIICFVARYLHGDWKSLMYKLNKKEG